MKTESQFQERWCKNKLSKSFDPNVALCALQDQSGRKMTSLSSNQIEMRNFQSTSSAIYKFGC